MKLDVGWGSDPYFQKTVSTLDELDEAMTEAIAARNEDGMPLLFTVTNPSELTPGGSVPVGLMIGVGVERAKVQWFGAGDGEGYSPDVPPWDGEPIEFDFGGVPTEETRETVRVLPGMALEAAREFMRTGRRPTCLGWFKG
ncbi:Imm1 family immunity protein [Longispora sp. K20-0274]|uniref:Imm1 family immunity protein n=1 Tax=Longispora sp. K20-0274 TaxID=3088255 RepID=UPI00399ADAC8